MEGFGGRGGEGTRVEGGGGGGGGGGANGGCFEGRGGEERRKQQKHSFIIQAHKQNTHTHKTHTSK